MNSAEHLPPCYDALGRVLRTYELTSGLTGQQIADGGSGTGAWLVETTYTTGATLPSPYAALDQRFLRNRVSMTVTDQDGNAGTTDDRVVTCYSKVGAHEIGHTLGFGHMRWSIMNVEYRNEFVKELNESIIGQILKNAGLGQGRFDPTFQGEGKIKQTSVQGTPPDDFNDGSVIRKEEQ